MPCGCSPSCLHPLLLLLLLLLGVLLVPAADCSCCCSVVTLHRDLLGQPHRFLVLSIESRLLVLLPTSHGWLVAVCPREVALGEQLTGDVVKTIMAVSL